MLSYLSDIIKNALSQTNAIRMKYAKLLLYFLIPLLFLKQIIINMIGGQRHLVSGLIVIYTMLIIYLTFIVAIKKISKHNIFYLPLSKVFWLSVVLSVYWLILVLTASGGSLIQKFVSGTYGGFYALIMWSPVVLFSDKDDIKIALKSIEIGTYFVCFVAFMQWALPENSMPVLLKGDESVFLSKTLFGTVRVNGLVGTPIDYAFLMALMLSQYYIAMIETRKKLSVIGFCITLVGLSISASRAFEMIAVITIVILSIRSKKIPKVTVFVIFIIVVIFPTIREYFFMPFVVKHSGYYLSILAKIEGIKEAIDSFLASPLTGAGVGFQLAPDFGDNSKKLITDGYWWAILIEAGMVAIALTFTILSKIFGIINRYANMMKPDRIESSNFANWGLAVIFIGVSGNFVNSSLNNQIMNILFFLIIGLVLSEINITSRIEAQDIKESISLS